MSLSPGIYEALLDEGLKGVLARHPELRSIFGKLDPEEEPARLAACFWHGCPLHVTQPKQNAQFWREKLARNRARDREVNRALRARGWRVLRIWEHELRRKNEGGLAAKLDRAV